MNKDYNTFIIGELYSQWDQNPIRIKELDDGTFPRRVDDYFNLFVTPLTDSSNVQGQRKVKKVRISSPQNFVGKDNTTEPSNDDFGNNWPNMETDPTNEWSYLQSELQSNLFRHLIGQIMVVPEGFYFKDPIQRGRNFPLSSRTLAVFSAEELINKGSLIFDFNTTLGAGEYLVVHWWINIPLNKPPFTERVFPGYWLEITDISVDDPNEYKFKFKESVNLGLLHIPINLKITF